MNNANELDDISNEKIKAILSVDKARREYHSFTTIRTLKDISNNYKLLGQMLRLEDILVKTKNKLNKIYQDERR